MHLSDFIEAHKSEVIERWKQGVVRRLSTPLEESQLVNDLPEFIDEVVHLLQTPTETWEHMDGAASHGQQRVRVGLDIGGLTEEMALVGECILALANEAGHTFSSAQICRLLRVMSKGTSTSVRAYAAKRDEQLSAQAAQHFSFIAHEIRNPLGTARLACQLLADEGAPEKHLRRLERALEQLSDLVDNSLVRARLEGEPELRLQTVSARDLLDDACGDLGAHIERRGQSLRIEADAFELDVDRKVMVSALSNLVRNAVKFSRNEGCIVVRARQEDERALFEIQDECGGMPEELPAKLFAPFVQAGNDRTGFGLGLMIVKQAVEAHRGSIRVANMPPTGCCFIVDIPRHVPDERVDLPGNA